MKQHLSAIRTLALAACVTLASTPTLPAASLFVPSLPAASSDVVTVQDSAKIIRRENRHDGGVWKRRPDRRGQIHREGRREAREAGRNNIYRPKVAPKYAYDAEGNFRVYDGNRPMRDDWHWSDDWRGWEDHGHWDDKGHWDDRHRHRPHQYKMNSFGYQQPSPALKQVLTAVPNGQ
ncbi:hypothetical protein [Mesorhizobium sp. KR9-304]|uniref:hypothetical protein n=1 Tax=Mesorhizobium sp. KR9-304 TaxID=3156614 RepID=UPI0032B45333